MNPTYNTAPSKVRFEWIGESWRLFSAQASTWIAVVFINGIISLVVAAAVGYPLGVFDSLQPILAHPHDPKLWAPTPGSPQPDALGQILYDAAQWVVSAFFYGGLFRMSNKQVRGEKIGIGDLFSGGPTFLPMLGFVIVFGLLSGIGALCLCVGMLAAYALFWPAMALIADGAGFSEAFTRSFEGMKQDWLSACFYVLVFGLLVLVSAIPFGLGLFITTPMIYLSTSLAYRDMIGMSGAAGGGGYPPAQGPPGAWPPLPPDPPAPGTPPAGTG